MHVSHVIQTCTAKVVLTLQKKIPGTGRVITQVKNSMDVIITRRRKNMIQYNITTYSI